MKESSPTDLSASSWNLIGYIILPIRFVLGWIYWGGGSRRFIYAPQKLNPDSHSWLANKLQSAMPGAILGVNHVISYLLQHFWLLYISLIIFSLLELLSGLGLIFGFFTRLCALVTLFIGLALMLNFGWEGGTCMDEWTMAVSSIAMSLVLLLSGSTVLSVDQKLQRIYQRRSYLRLLTSGPLREDLLKKFSLILLLFTILFTTLTYNYYRGAIFSPYHPGPISPTTFALKLSQGRLLKNGTISFDVDVNAGTTAVPTYINRVEITDSRGQVVEEWTAQALRSLPLSQITNVYTYNKITTAANGLVAPESSKARITLQTTTKTFIPPDNYVLQVYLVNGKKWSLPLHKK